MFNTILGFGKEYGGPVRDLTPGLCDVPARTWPEPTPDNIKGTLDVMFALVPENISIPEDVTLRKLAGMAIRPTFEHLPKETRDLVTDILPGFFEKR